MSGFQTMLVCATGANTSNIALSVRWPRPVAAKEPYNVTRNDAGCNESTLLRKAVAALRGPIVWDDDGPYPILYMVLMVSIGIMVIGAFFRCDPGL